MSELKFISRLSFINLIVKSSLVKYIKIVENNEKYNALYKPVEDAVNSWLTTIENTDKPTVKTSMDEYMKAFPNAYMSTL